VFMPIRIRHRDIVEEKSILIDMYNEQMAHARHHEVLRATVSNIIIVVSAALLGLITYDKQINIDDLAMIIFLIIVGLFGYLITMKHYQHLQRHLQRANGFVEKIEELYPLTEISRIMEEARIKNIKEFPILSKARLNTYWGALHIIIILLGVFLLLKVILS